MSELDQVVEAEQEVTDPPAEADFSSQRDFEAEAREMGWRPKEDFKGDESKWKPAEQFVKDGETILPIVKSQLDREREARERDRKEFEDRFARMERMNAETRKREQAAHKTEVERIKRDQRQAAEDGDMQKFDSLAHDIDALNATAPAEVTTEDPNAEYQQRVDNFQAENIWYGTDDVLTAYANHDSQKRASANPNITFEENMRLTVEAVKSQFPDKFGAKPKPAANGHAAVDGGSNFPGKSQKKSAADSLPAEALKQAKADVAAGMYKSVDAWAVEYNK